MKFLTDSRIGLVLFFVLIIFPAIHPVSDLNTNFPTNPVGVAEDVSDDEKEDSRWNRREELFFLLAFVKKQNFLKFRKRLI